MGFLALIIIIILIIHEELGIRNYKKKHKKDAEEWCNKTHYRFVHKCDPPKDWDGKF